MNLNFAQNTQLRRILTVAALTTILLGLIGVFALMRAEFASARELRVAGEQTVQTRDLLSELLVLHLDAETAVRGYVITEDMKFLEPYERALAQRASIFSRLKREGDIKEVARLARLEQLSRGKFANAARNIDDVGSGNAAVSRERISGGRGKELMDSIRAEIAKLDSIESNRLNNLNAAGAAGRTGIQRLLNGFLIGILLAFGMAGYLIDRSIRERRAALDRSTRLAERQRAMFDGAVDGMLYLDGSGRILRLNPSIVRMFGYPEGDLLGKHNMFLMADDYSLEQSERWLASVGEAGVDGAGRRQEFTGLRADGSTFETEVAISQVGGDADWRYVAAIRDISHRKQAERMKSEFVSTVSHELRTPLTSIGGSLGLLAAGAVGSLDEKAARLVNIARNNCERLIRLINDILDIEKIESGKMDFDMRSLTLGPLIDRTVQANRQFAEDHHVDIEIELPPWPQCIRGDPDRLEQLLTNLVSNAVKHSPAHDTVTVRTRQHGSTFRVEVLDRGKGVPQEFRDRIFSRFAMADGSDTRTRGGTGLGLAIVREIAERHHGHAGFEDREGGGSIFFVALPSLEDSTEVHETAKSDLPNLLHVDDDYDCLSVVGSAFNGRANIVSAGSLSEARSLLASTDLAGAIIDVGMAGQSGLELLPLLRKEKARLPIVLFTASDDPHAEAQADAVLIKSKSQLDALVETTMALVARAGREAA